MSVENLPMFFKIDIVPDYGAELYNFSAELQNSTTDLSNFNNEILLTFNFTQDFIAKVMKIEFFPQNKAKVIIDEYGSKL